MFRLFNFYFPKWYLRALAGVVLLSLLWGFTHIETYFYPYPAIDTQFSKGFSEAIFDRITIGMTKDEVKRMLGDPLIMEDREEGLVKWGYSMDGKCSWGDFAWLGRSLQIGDGKVVRIEKTVYYD